MRIVLSLLLLLLTSASAYAQTLQIERIDVLEHGIYTADESNCSNHSCGNEERANTHVLERQYEIVRGEVIR